LTPTSAVLDEAHLGDIHGAFGTIRLSDVAPRRTWRRRLLTLAAGQASADGRVSLGVLYETGRGVAQDYSRAMAMYALAAGQGNAQAMASIGSVIAPRYSGIR